MSGTGPFRHSRSSARTPAEEHLGDRLAAFVDGELGAEMRERVAAHLATCEQCKAEADEQRRLKEAVAGAMPPALSAGLLARLQGLPGGGPDGPKDDGPFGGGFLGRVRPSAESADTHFGPRAGLGGGRGFGDLGDPVSGGEADSFGSALAPTGERLEGFRIHEIVSPGSPYFRRAVTPGGAGRSGSRGRRFAFAAAGAFSMAAIALGGALPLDAAIEGGAVPDGAAATPVSSNSALRATRQQAGALSTAPAAGATPVSDVQRLLAPLGGHGRAALPSPVDGVSPSDVASATPLSAYSVPPRAMPVLGTPHGVAPGRTTRPH